MAQLHRCSYLDINVLFRHYYVHVTFKEVAGYFKASECIVCLMATAGKYLVLSKILLAI